MIHAPLTPTANPQPPLFFTVTMELPPELVDEIITHLPLRQHSLASELLAGRKIVDLPELKRPFRNGAPRLSEITLMTGRHLAS